MDIEDWRRQIDEIDLKLVELVNQRAQAAREIGKLKRVLDLPVYEPDRERLIFDNVSRANGGPLPSSELHRIFERIIDVMRALQRTDGVGRQDKPQGAERSNP
jgi:chorismate mutase